VSSIFDAILIQTQGEYITATDRMEAPATPETIEASVFAAIIG